MHSQAKTIDLCNNPKTKEPKLQAARRILPEWEGLDRLQAEATLKAEAALGLGGEATTAGGSAGEASAAGEGRLIHEDEEADVEVSPEIEGAESRDEHDEL